MTSLVPSRADTLVESLSESLTFGFELIAGSRPTFARWHRTGSGDRLEAQTRELLQPSSGLCGRQPWPLRLGGTRNVVCSSFAFGLVAGTHANSFSHITAPRQTGGNTPDCASRGENSHRTAHSALEAEVSFIGPHQPGKNVSISLACATV